MNKKTKAQVLDEERFHDAWAEAIKVDELLVEESFLATTVIENRFILERVGVFLSGKIV